MENRETHGIRNIPGSGLQEMKLPVQAYIRIVNPDVITVARNGEKDRYYNLDSSLTPDDRVLITACNNKEDEALRVLFNPELDEQNQIEIVKEFVKALEQLPEKIQQHTSDYSPI